MYAVLNIYKDCTSEEPTKQYICRRLLLGVSKKVQALSDQLNVDGMSEKEQEAITLDILKTIFPHFDETDFDYLDPNEWLDFVNNVAIETNAIVMQAAKK